MSKLKNYGLWVALFSLLSLVLGDFVPDFDLGRYQMYVDAFLVLLIAAGIVSNPTDGKWFKDGDK